MKQSHIALIVFPEKQEIVAAPWLVEPSKPMHSGYTDEETKIMNHYYGQCRKYEEELKFAIKCDQVVATKILREQYPNRKVFPNVRVHYNVTNITLGELLGRTKRIFAEGEKITCVHTPPLPGNDLAPDLQLGKEYPLKKIFLDSQGNQHFDVGLRSFINYVRSYETGEPLPDTDNIHWCHPSRFI